MGEHQLQHEINYSDKVIQNGREYFQSLAHQLADYITGKTFEEYRLTAEYGFLSSKIFIETVLTPGGPFVSTKYSPKKCVGVVLYDIETNQMILRKTNVDLTIHEFHADGNLDNCFGVQYDVFKYLRDSDLVQIHTIENVSGVKTAFCYTITKIKALRNGRFLHFKGHGKQFFIPIADFRKSDGKTIKEKPKRKRATKKK